MYWAVLEATACMLYAFLPLWSFLYTQHPGNRERHMVRFQEMVLIITLWDGQGYSQENQIIEWLASPTQSLPSI